MLSTQSQFAIAPQPVDELTRASTELATHLESIANSIASHALPPSFENIRPGLRNVALFLNTMKTWTVQQKETLPGLLAEYVETNYPECLDQIGWVPDRLRDAALSRLSFAVEKITGAENLVDEPKFECFYGCKFVSLRDFGTRAERWLFEAPDGRKLPVFGRDEFSVNRF